MSTLNNKLLVSIDAKRLISIKTYEGNTKLSVLETEELITELKNNLERVKQGD